MARRGKGKGENIKIFVIKFKSGVIKTSQRTISINLVQKILGLKLKGVGRRWIFEVENCGFAGAISSIQYTFII